MPDNPQAAPGGGFSLSDHHVLELSGRDAAAFAHAQFMNDVAALAPGHWQWNGWLTPKGRVVALFALLKWDAERLWLLLPDADPAGIAAQLRRFVFRSQLRIDSRPDLHATGGFGHPVAAAGALLAEDATGAELDIGGVGRPRRLRIGRVRAPEEHDALARWRGFDLEHGLPRLPQSQVEQWTPQMLSLERLQAFSVKKGCYPGQEIVARTHFLGQAKRGLALFEAAAPVAAGTEVSDGERSLGTVVSSAGNLALAVLPMERGATPLRAGDLELIPRPLHDGLAR
jgi:folate-binding protein YgfZ